MAAAEAAATRALDHHQRFDMPLEHARTLLVAGQVHRRAKHKDIARQTLEAAAQMFEQLGAASWAQRARTELARLVCERATAPRELTVSERRVAELRHRAH